MNLTYGMASSRKLSSYLKYGNTKIRKYEIGTSVHNLQPRRLHQTATQYATFPYYSSREAKLHPYESRINSPKKLCFIPMSYYSFLYSSKRLSYIAHEDFHAFKFYYFNKLPSLIFESNVNIQFKVPTWWENRWAYRSPPACVSALLSEKKAKRELYESLPFERKLNFTSASHYSSRET